MTTFTIDHRTIQSEPGESILEAALRFGIRIPNLCHANKISHTGACRLCMVKVEGRPGFVPSCTTTPEEGMLVTAFSPEIDATRRIVLDLAMSNHNDDCISCTRDGDCELQDLAFRFSLGKKDRKFPPLWEDLNKTSDFTSPVLNYDASKCIQCQRCLKACAEIQGKGILNFHNRGIRTTVGTGFAHWGSSKCDGCGECAQICPVGAITPKQFYGKMQRVRSKDTEEVVQTTCPYCGVGCQLDIHLRKTWEKGVEHMEIVKVEGGETLPNHGKTCVKGRFGLDYSTRDDRLKKAMIRKDGVLVEVEWQEAITYTVRRLVEIREKHGSDAFAGLSSARVTNEENYLFQKFVRSIMGTNNVDHCARLCHASTVAGLAATLGTGAMSNSISELENADVILVTGSNTTETHPVIATYIKRAVLLNKAKLLVFDPRRIDLVPYAHLWLRQKNGTDIAWANGLLHVIISQGLHHKDFVAQHTEGFEAMWEVVKKYDPATVEGITGIPRADLIAAAEIYGSAKKGSIVWSMGITQHAHGTDNVRSLSNLALVTGNLGRESTGVNPLRGQNNVQGACDMGALPPFYTGYQRVADPAALTKFETAWKCKLPTNPGLTVVEIMNAVLQDKIKSMFIMGENPMVSDPNLNHVREALEHVEFLVVQDIFLTETAQLADVVFPSCSSLEKEGTFTNTERRVLPVRNVLSAPGDARPDWAIIQHLAQAMGFPWHYDDAASILREINQVTPSYGGITPERLLSGHLLQWPCPNPTHPGTPILHKTGVVRGKGLLCGIEHQPPKEVADPAYPFVLSTGRVLHQYHTGSMTRRTGALPQFGDKAYIEMCKADVTALGFRDGEKVKVSSRRGTIELAIKETDRVVQGSVFIPFHYAEAAANILTIDALDPVAKIPEYKACAVQISKCG